MTAVSQHLEPQNKDCNNQHVPFWTNDLFSNEEELTVIEKSKPPKLRYISDLKPDMQAFYNHHKNKEPESYKEVHEALQNWSSDEECTNNKTLIY